MSIYKFKRTVLLAVLLSSTAFVYADDAVPVYDVDSMPSQFDGQADSGSTSSAAMPRASSPAQVQSEQTYVSSAPSSLSNDQRLTQVEQQVNNMLHSNSTTRVEELQAEVQTLRGQVESLTHQVQQQQTQLRATYTDLDKRISKQQQAVATNTKVSPVAEGDTALTDTNSAAKPVTQHNKVLATTTTQKLSHASANAKSDAAAATVQPNVAEEQQTYQVAYDLIKEKKYNEAIVALQKMLVKYPSGQFAANAHYWLGELYSLTNKNDLAATEFATIVSDFSDSPKVSNAQFKLGMLYSTQSKWPDAKLAFKKVISKYPDTAPARLASEQLKQMKQLGH